MSDEAALLKAIIAHPDEDTPRLIYADWLDEHAPDKMPSPAAGPSARAEYIRVQCRLARRPYDDPEYPELLERERDLADWLRTHAKGDPSLAGLPEFLHWRGQFDSGIATTYVRGFPEEVEYEDFEDDPDVNVARILEALPQAFEEATVRTLQLEEAYGEEIAGVVGSPAVRPLRGLKLIEVYDDEGADPARAIATSPHLGNLKHLSLDFDLGTANLEWLAEATSLDSLESLSLDEPTAEGLRALGGARWFRNLRSLRVWINSREVFKSVAEFPKMPNLVNLALNGVTVASTAAMRRFVASQSFPRLARLEIDYGRLEPEHVELLARAPWPLRHLRVDECELRKAGAEALASADFAESLRVLELSDCTITAGGVQALAGSAKLAGLRHLDLHSNPVGVGGLAAIARSEHLRGLRALTLDRCNTSKAGIDAASMLNFLTSLDAPELRHLDLEGMPVGVRGARVIGSGGKFAKLTRLGLNGCGLREKGARAIVESDSLTNLTVLELADNGAGKGVAKLSDATTLPRLARANLRVNRVSTWAAARLRRRPGVEV